jgi:hypothetical protein
MTAVLFSALGALGAVAGLFSTIFKNYQHSRAEKRLQRAIKSHTDEARKLEGLTGLTEARPNPVQLAEASEIITSIANKLDDSDRSDILTTLARGSDKSKANYIVKLVKDQE